MTQRSAAAELLKLHMRALYADFREEVKFHPKRKWRFDFMVGNVAIEVDGGNRLVRKTKDGKHVAVGRHTKDADYEKLNAAAVMGILVLRFSPAMVRSGEAIGTIDALLHAVADSSAEKVAK